MPFRPLPDYPRRAHLEFYRAHPAPFYATTFELDGAPLRARLAAAGLPVYAGFCWAFHRALLTLPAFRVRLVDGQPVEYDGLRLGLTVPAPRRTFSFATLEWDADPAAFFPRAAAAMEEASRAVDLSGGREPDFAYYTALPGVPFTGFTHVPPVDPTAGQPQIAFGRFTADGAALRVPVGVQVNHLFIDGVDLGDLHAAAAESFAAAL
jgi:chloramphenicol O-acetyltransferase type A